MFKIVMSVSVISAVIRWSALPRAVFRCNPNALLISGSKAIGRVAQTDATVRIPANR